MGRPAARTVDKHICSMTGPAPHKGGLILVVRHPNVFVGGRQAAVLNDLALCAVGWPNAILMGSFTVLVNGIPAARKYDLTTHAGMIIEGEPTVLIGRDTPAELLWLAIMRIANSEYGKTEEGKKTIALLEKKLDDGSLRAGKTEPGEDGYFDRSDNLVVDETILDDVDRSASLLVHEGKHAQQDENVPVLDREVEARKEQDKLYQEQQGQGFFNPDLEKNQQAIKDGTLPERVSDIDYRYRR